MAVKAVITRNVPPEKAGSLRPLLLKMRALAMEQPGYISGETLVNLDHAGEYIVLSTWSTLEDWKSWLSDSRRIAIQLEIDALLGTQTEFRVYCHG